MGLNRRQHVINSVDDKGTIHTSTESKDRVYSKLPTTGTAQAYAQLHMRNCMYSANNIVRIW
jgi:hypothetical protein